MTAPSRTPEQWAEIDRQKQENPGGRDVSVALTPEQVADWRAHAEAEQTPEARAANVHHSRKLQIAAAEEGFSGSLRRAIHEELCRSKRSPQRLAAEIGIEALQLEAFRTGDAPLPTDVVDRLVKLLGLRLVAEAV